MELLQLEYFRKIAERKSITKAAKELHVTQPALSNTLKRLETNLGVKLFDRHNNTLKLNDNGIRVYRTARQIDELLSEGISSLKTSPLPAGSLSFAFYTHSPLLTESMHRYREYNPNVSYRFVSGSRLHKELSFSDADFLLYSDSSEAPVAEQFERITLTETHFFLVVPRRFFQTDLDTISFTELPDIAKNLSFCFMKRRDEQLEGVYYNLLDKGFSPNVAYIVDSLTMKLELLWNGQCAAIVPDADAALLKTNPALQLLKITDSDLDSFIYLAWHSDQQDALLLQDFLDFLLKELHHPAISSF